MYANQGMIVPMKDPLVRRFILGTALSALFVWVVIRYFGLPVDRAMSFLLGSFIFVGGLIVLAAGVALIMSLLRRRRDDDPMPGQKQDKDDVA